MRKPREIYNEEEQAKLDDQAIVAFNRLTKAGIVISYELCFQMVELAFLTEQVNEIDEKIKSLIRGSDNGQRSNNR